jgi:acyl carrier protein
MNVRVVTPSHLRAPPGQSAARAPHADTFATDLVDWLNRTLVPPGVLVGPDTPLFAGGLINSIRILELIAWTERAAGITIPDRMIRMDNFASARRIAETFCAELGSLADDPSMRMREERRRNVER